MNYNIQSFTYTIKKAIYVLLMFISTFHVCKQASVISLAQTINNSANIYNGSAHALGKHSLAMKTYRVIVTCVALLVGQAMGALTYQSYISKGQAVTESNGMIHAQLHYKEATSSVDYAIHDNILTVGGQNLSLAIYRSGYLRFPPRERMQTGWHHGSE